MGCSSSRPRPGRRSPLSATKTRPHASSVGSGSARNAVNTIASSVSDAITNFNPLTMLHRRLAPVAEEEDVYSSFSNKSQGVFPRLSGMDPLKILVYLTDEDLARCAQVNRAFCNATRTFDCIKYAKLESKPHFKYSDWYRMALASRGAGQTWAKLRRRLCRDPATLCATEAYSDLSPERFSAEYEKASRPVVIKGCALNWPAAEWTMDSLEHRFGNCLFRFNDLHGEEICFSDFVRYGRTTDDDSPLGLYDSQVGASEDDVRRTMMQEYSIPTCFGADLFDLVRHSPLRPPHRWVLVGFPRGGTEMHVDPLYTSAWVTLLQGRKRWALFPPDFDDRALGGVNSTEHVLPRVPSAVEWFMRFWATPATAGAVEIVQQPGDTVFVPGGWKHIVINLDETVAITHNYAPVENVQRIREVVAREEPELAQVWEEALKKRGVV